MQEWPDGRDAEGRCREGQMEETQRGGVGEGMVSMLSQALLFPKSPRAHHPGKTPNLILSGLYGDFIT